MYSVRQVNRIFTSSRPLDTTILTTNTLSFTQKRGRLDLKPFGGRSSVSGIIATVFGCTGFLGRYVVNKLGRIGSQVVIPYRGEEKSYTHMKVMGDLGQIIPMKWDIRDKDSIREAVKYSNVIINLVGSRYDTRNFTMHDVHVDGAKRIAEVAREFNVDRFIHVSAVGASVNAESDRLKTLGEGEAVVKSIFPDVTIIKSTTMFGNGDQFLNSHSTMMRYWPFYPLITPNKRIQPVWVMDVASAVVNAIQHYESIGKTYEVGGTQVYTLREIADWVKMVLKLKPRYVEVGEEFVWHLGYWLGQHRNPRYTLDSIKETSDLVLSGNYPGIESLDVKPLPLDSSMAMSFILHFRRPLRILDITLADEELPEGISDPEKPSY